MDVTRALFALLAFLSAAAFGFFGLPSLTGTRNHDGSVNRPEIKSSPAKKADTQVAAPSATASEQNPRPASVPLKSSQAHSTPLVAEQSSSHVVPAQVISQVEPEWTEAARRANATGSVLLALFVTRSGFPQNIRVVRGLGYGLNRRAIDAVSHWRFRPAVQNGQPVVAESQVEVRFH